MIIKRIQIFLAVLQIFLLSDLTIAHNEFLKFDGYSYSTTNDPNEAVQWSSYSNIPLNILFTEESIPYPLTLTRI